jgi:antirestriction protein
MSDADPAGSSPEAEPVDPPRIYVASLTDYNAGRLHGRWIDANQDTEALTDEVRAMLKASPTSRHAEEFAIHDYENFGALRLSEYESLEVVSAIAKGLADHGPAFAAWADHVGHEPALLDGFSEAYRGEWRSVSEYADELLDDLGAQDVLTIVPDWLQPYVKLDVDGFARDLELSGDVWTAPTATDDVFIFDGTV